MAELNQKLDSERREPRIGQEAHRSCAKRVELVLGESGCVCECLSDVVFFEVRQVGDDLRGCHAAGHKVDDVRHGDAKAADRRPAGQHIRILRDSIERLRHGSIVPVERVRYTCSN